MTVRELVNLLTEDGIDPGWRVKVEALIPAAIGTGWTRYELNPQAMVREVEDEVIIIADK